MINRRKVDKETFDKFRKIGKHYGVTVNDLMLAVYMHSLYEFGNYPATDTLTIPCMVDLRRHIEGGEEAGGLTNHTGFMQCSVEGVGTTINDTLVKVLHSVRKSKHDKFMGLYSLPLLKLAYTIFPYAISETAIKIGYLNPLIGMSNIGVLNPDLLTMGPYKPVDGFMTGAVKYKPYMQLALTSMNGELTMTIAIRGNDDDKVLVQKFFDIIVRNINTFIRGERALSRLTPYPQKKRSAQTDRFFVTKGFHFLMKRLSLATSVSGASTNFSTVILRSYFSRKRAISAIIGDA